MVGLLWNTLLNGREISRRPLIDLSDQWLGISLLFDLHLQTYAYRPSGVLPNVYTVYCGTEFAAASTLHIMCRLRKWLMFSHTQIQTVQSIVGSLHKIHCTFILAKWIVFLNVCTFQMKITKAWTYYHCTLYYGIFICARHLLLNIVTLYILYNVLDIILFIITSRISSTDSVGL